jgi:hypothetical protein
VSPQRTKDSLAAIRIEPGQCGACCRRVTRVLIQRKGYPEGPKGRVWYSFDHWASETDWAYHHCTPKEAA